ACISPTSTPFPYTTLFRSHGEHGFLHLTRVVHAGQQDLALGKVDDDTTIGVGAVTFWNALEVGGVEDLPFLLVGSVIGFRADKRSEEHTSELQSRENLVCR